MKKTAKPGAGSWEEVGYYEADMPPVKVTTLKLTPQQELKELAKLEKELIREWNAVDTDYDKATIFLAKENDKHSREFNKQIDKIDQLRAKLQLKVEAAAAKTPTKVMKGMKHA